MDLYCQGGSFIIYGGALIPASYGFELFNKINSRIFEETKNYSTGEV